MQSATKGVNDLKDNVKRSVSAQTNSFNALGNTVRNVVGGVIVAQTLIFIHNPEPSVVTKQL